MSWRALFLVGVAGLGVGCGGGDPYCGDGETDQGEECDDGNDDETDFCRQCVTWLPAQTTIRWEFNKDETVGFSGDACVDVGASTVDVELVGPSSPPVMSDGCSSRQVVFSELPAGSYVAKVTPRDASGASMVTAPVESAFEMGTVSTEHEVIVPITKGKLDVGPWQRVFYGEWDGQRRKRVVIKVMGE